MMHEMMFLKTPMKVSYNGDCGCHMNSDGTGAGHSGQCVREKSMDEVLRESNQQLLNKLEEGVEKKRKNLPKDPLDITPREQMKLVIQPVYQRYVSPEESFNQGLDTLKSLIQKERERL